MIESAGALLKPGPIAVLGAMDGEIRAFLDQSSKHREKYDWQEFRFHLLEMEGRDLVIAKSGVGKTVSAMLCQRLIDLYNPSSIICTGIAGALNPAYRLGDTVIAEDCMQYDLNAKLCGTKRGQVPFTKYRIIPSDKRLLDLASGYQPENGEVHRGRVLTGDSFFTESEDLSYAYMREELKGDAVEMEGASVGLVAMINKIPFLLVRTISDFADGKINIKIVKFLRRASKNSCACLRHILRGMSV